MQVFTEKDLPARKPQFMQISCDGNPYDMIPLHVSIDSLHLRKSDSKPVEHTHNVYHVVLYNRSKGRFSLDGRAFAAGPGVLALSSPNESHHYQSIEKGEVSYSEFSFSYLSFRGKALQIPFKKLLELYSGLELPVWKTVLQLDKDDYNVLHKIISGIAETKEDPSGMKSVRLYRGISELFNFLAAQYARLGMPPGDDSISSGLEKARDYIHSHYWEKIPIGRLAKLACFSKGHFQREFRKRYNLSPVEYITEYRISAAKNLLRTTPHPCAEIAEKVGFNDIFYFSKVFKRLSGKSPVQYRKG